LVVLADTAATIPLGALLALKSRRRSLFMIAVTGFAMMSVVTILTMLVLTATPHLWRSSIAPWASSSARPC